MSPADQARLEARVAGVRRDGHAVAENSGGSGGPFVVAAPVFDENGLRATIAVLGAGNLDLPPVLEQLLATAAALGDELGSPLEGSAGADV